MKIPFVVWELLYFLVATGKTSLLVQKIFEFYKIKFDTFDHVIVKVMTQNEPKCAKQN